MHVAAEQLYRLFLQLNRRTRQTCYMQESGGTSLRSQRAARREKYKRKQAATTQQRKTRKKPRTDVDKDPVVYKILIRSKTLEMREQPCQVQQALPVSLPSLKAAQPKQPKQPLPWPGEGEWIQRAIALRDMQLSTIGTKVSIAHTISDPQLKGAVAIVATSSGGARVEVMPLVTNWQPVEINPDSPIFRFYPAKRSRKTVSIARENLSVLPQQVTRWSDPVAVRVASAILVEFCMAPAAVAGGQPPITQAEPAFVESMMLACCALNPVLCGILRTDQMQNAANPGKKWPLPKIASRDRRHVHTDKVAGILHSAVEMGFVSPEVKMAVLRVITALFHVVKA